jgi:hypothetical protein
VSELLGAVDETLAALAVEVIYLLAAPSPPHLHSRAEVLMPLPLYGNRAVAKKMLCLAQGWGAKSQVRGLAPIEGRPTG